MAKKKSSNGDGVGADEGAKAKPYVVLARKYRPRTFDELIGQSAMVTTLRNAFASGRIAQGYMLTGVRGVGKTTTARILARAMNYEAPGVDRPTIDMPALGRHCLEIMEGRHPDVFEIDAASNTGVDNVREIIESAQYNPIIARTKVFIIDEVHMLSKGAFNALLKTLEEPPPHVRFIFATTEIRKVPVTVLSRCQRFDLRRVEQPALIAHFKSIAANEGASTDDDALALIARAAEGSVRDGLSILDQAIAMGEARVTAPAVRAMLGLADRARIMDLAAALFRGDVQAALAEFHALYSDGAEPLQILGDFAEAVHVVARVKAVGAEPGSEQLSVEEKARAAALAAELSMPYLSRAWQMLAKGLEETSKAPNPLAAAEMVLIRLAYVADLPTPDEIIRTLGGENAVARRTPAPRGESSGGLMNVSRETTPRAAADEEDFVERVDVAVDSLDEADSDLELELDLAPVAPAAPAAADPRSFDDVVALVGLKRDAKLKLHLEDHVSLVKFDAAAGSIDLFLLPGAPAEIANELREKLNRWTGRRWVVVLSKEPGAPAIGAVRRAREAAELEDLKSHPAVRAILAEFPDAKIVEVRPIEGMEERDNESQTGRAQTRRSGPHDS